MMARTFDGTSSQYLTNSNAPVTAPPFTISVLFNAANITATGYIVSIGDISETNLYYAISLDGADTDSVQVLARNAAGTDICTATDTYAAGSWYHALGVF